IACPAPRRRMRPAWNCAVSAACSRRGWIGRIWRPAVGFGRSSWRVLLWLQVIEMTRQQAMQTLEQSAALWNRRHLDLQSQETIAQIMDRGSMADWRALWLLQADDLVLAERMLVVATQVPIDTGWFWQAALAGRG